MKKSEILEIVRELPDEGDVDLDKVIYTLWFRRKIDLALREADEIDGIPHEEVMRELDEWLKDDERTMASRREE